TAREREDDARPLSHTRIDPDRSGVGLDETLRDRKAKPDAARPLTRPRQTYERFEDPLAVAGRDTWTVIANLEADVAVVARDRDPDLGSRRRELRRVLDEVREDLLDLHVVELDRRQVLWDVQADGVTGGHRTHSSRDVLDEGTDVVPRL